MTVSLRVILTSLLLLGGLASQLRALDGSETFTLDLPFGADQATPAWLGHPATPSATFATLDLPITSPDPAAALLVTVFFQEQNGGFLRISWQNAAIPTDSTTALPGPGEAVQSSVLCENFYEGIGMNNQRSLLVPADMMKQPGQLVFQCGDSTLGISRIKLEWLQNSTGLSSPVITDTLVTPANGKTQLAGDLAGNPATAQDPAWHDRIVDVPITDVPVRIEQGVDFTVQMEGTPTLARLAVKETGLPWGQHLVVWLNNQRAGIVQPAVPKLGDAGYPDNNGTTYVGWREGTFYVPVNLFTPGNDTLQFSAEPDVPPSTPVDAGAPPAPLAVKDVLLELDYPATSASAVQITPVTNAAPAGEVPDPNPPASASIVPPATTPPASVPAPSLEENTTAGQTPSPANVDAPSTPAPNAQNPGLLSLPAGPSSSSNP